MVANAQEAPAAKSQQELVSIYLKAVEKEKIDPNFWMSEPYFYHAQSIKIRTHESESGLVQSYSVVDQTEDGPEYSLFPSFYSFPGGKGFFSIYPPEEVMVKSPCLAWACGDKPADYVTGEYTSSLYDDLIFGDKNKISLNFLDFNYFYNPKNFLKTTGSRWKIWRKNLKKFPYTDDQVVYRPIRYNSISHVLKLKTLMVKWLEAQKEDMPIEDEHTIYHYLFFQRKQDKIWGIFRRTDEVLLAVNAWDENYKYLNYRYCFYDPNIPGANYYARHRFYTLPEIINSRKLVNDGGILGSETLKFFKDHLNPVKRKLIYTWNPKKRRNPS